MYPTVRNVGRGNTRCKKKVSPLYTGTRAYKAGAHSERDAMQENYIVESTCGAPPAKRNRLSIAPVAGQTELNEFTAGHTLLRDCYTGYTFDSDDDGDVGMRTLTLVRAFVLHGTELSFMVRRRCSGSKINALSADCIGAWLVKEYCLLLDASAPLLNENIIFADHTLYLSTGQLRASLRCMFQHITLTWSIHVLFTRWLYTNCFHVGNKICKLS